MKKFMLFAGAKVSQTDSSRYRQKRCELACVVSDACLLLPSLALTDRQKYPDWANAKLEVEAEGGGAVIFQVVRRDAGHQSSENVAGDEHLSDGQTEGLLLMTHTP